MLAIARQVEHYVQTVKENNRLIAREKQLIDLTSIVLVDEFFGAAVEPLLRTNPYFADLFNLHGARIKTSVNSWLEKGQVACFPIPFDRLTEDMQLYYRAVHDDEHFEERRERIRIATDELTKLRGQDYSAIAEGFENLKVDNKTFSGTYLMNIVYAMNIMRPKKDAITHFEFWSSIRGEGRDVLQFWRDVNSLKDYSGLFPDLQKPQGNKRDDSGARQDAKGWKPAWAG